MKKRDIQKIISCTLILLMTLLNIQTLEAKQIKIHNVPKIKQHPELPTGCEATALTMLLNYSGMSITKEQVARDMPKAPRPVFRNGRLYAEHPNNAFLGDPFSKNGFGIYAPALLKMVENYLPGRAQDLSGGSFQKIYDTIDEGRPVMIWSTIGMLEVQRSNQWIVPSGELFTWKIPQHAVVVVGYDDTHVYINDPTTGTERKYTKQVVENRWRAMGSQAIAITSNTNAYATVPLIKEKDAIIDGITYTNLIREDRHGQWIQARFLNGIHGNTVITYQSETKTPIIQIKETQPIESNTSRWLIPNFRRIKESIPRNINRQYFIQIPLDPNEKEVITYNVKGKQVLMQYKIVDGTTYVNKEWVEKFYNIKIQ